VVLVDVVHGIGVEVVSSMGLVNRRLEVLRLVLILVPTFVEGILLRII
jgi:hypothetical protein